MEEETKVKRKKEENSRRKALEDQMQREPLLIRLLKIGDLHLGERRLFESESNTGRSSEKPKVSRRGQIREVRKGKS